MRGSDGSPERHGEIPAASNFSCLAHRTIRVFRRTNQAATEAVLEQMNLCLGTAGSSLENVLKRNVYCTSVDLFSKVNEIYRRYSPNDFPARIFIGVPAWNGDFDIEIDCMAAVAD